VAQVSLCTIADSEPSKGDRLIPLVPSQAVTGPDVNRRGPRPGSRARGAADTSRPASQRDSEAARTILVVDDEAEVAALVSDILTAEGYAVTTTTFPGLALQLIAEHSFDLLVTDVMMPRMTGCELARQVHHLSPHTRVLFMSGYVVREVIATGLPCLLKPFSTDRLVGAVTDALHRVSPFARRTAVQRSA
jgi:CheY-like chemotaxis protein